jgi:acetyl esterase/lipase
MGGSRRRRTRVALILPCLVATLGSVAVVADAAPAVAAPTASLAPPLHPYGYRMVAGDGGVFDFGSARYFGSMGGLHLNRPVVGLADAPSDVGYWEVASDGGIFAFGDAGFYGSMGGQSLNAPVIGMLSSTDGRGYLMFAADGGIFAFGDAGFYGSLGGERLASAVSGVTATADGRGYWILQKDGSISAFGDAVIPAFTSATNSFGSPAMSIAATPDGGGYWITTMDGVVHAFGDASLWPSTGGSVGVWTTGGVSTPDGLGYWTANIVGAVEGYGDASLSGSMLGRPLNAPVVAISTLRAPPPVVGTYQGATPQNVDIYPSPTPGAPVVVLVHGGAYTGGTDMASLVPGEATYLQASGVTVYAINYDLATTATPAFPMEVTDTLAAIAYAEATASRFNGNPGTGGSNVTLIGGSSGGTLVALAAERVPVKGVVDLSGPADFPSYVSWLESGDDTSLVSSIETTFGCTPLSACNQTQLLSWSPADHPGLPGEKWLIGQSVADPLVPLSQGQVMASRLSGTLDLLGGGDHAFELCPWLNADILAVVDG